LFWHFLQLLLRPLGCALLALALLDGFPLQLRLLGALAAVVVCAFTHVLSWGLKLSLFLSPGRRVSRTTMTLAEDTLVLAFLALAIQRPDLAFSLSAPILLLGLLLGGPLHYLARFGVSLTKDLVWGLVSPPRWREGPELPPWIRGLEGTAEASGIRGVPAGFQGLPGLRGFREGWLLEMGGKSLFVFRRRRKPRVIPLDGIPMGREQELGLALRVPMEVPKGNRSALFLQRGSAGLKSHK